MTPAFHFNPALLAALAPDLLVLLGAFVVLALDIPLRGQKDKAAVFFASLAVLLAAFVLQFMTLHSPAVEVFPGMIVSDRTSSYARLGLLLCGIFTLLLSRSNAALYGLVQAEFHALLLFAVSGMMLFTGCTNLMAAFVALETFSLAFYVLAGFDRRVRANREAAFKYFVIGALAAAFFLFGMAIVYGCTGSVAMEGLRAAFESAQPAAADAHGHAAPLAAGKVLLYGGVAMMMVGLGFKVGLAPFHAWAPDTYEGAPTPVTAFLSAGAKVAGFAAMLRLLSFVPLDSPAMISIISTLAVLTMLVANFGALKQEGLKRLMAYSSIAHSGYALVAFAGATAATLPFVKQGVMIYVLVYTLMNFGAFALLIGAEAGLGKGKDEPLKLEHLQGLGFERPWFSFALAVLMFAMAGIPPTAGFIAKLLVFSPALKAGQQTLVVLAVLNSALSAAFYLRVLVALYMKPKTHALGAPAMSGWLAITAAGATALSLIWGLFPGFLLSLFQ